MAAPSQPGAQTDGERLKQLPAPEVALKYYMPVQPDEVYLFDEFQARAHAVLERVALPSPLPDDMSWVGLSESVLTQSCAFGRRPRCPARGGR